MVCILLFFLGVYSLIKGTNHRAHIPSTINWQFKIKSTSSLYTSNVSSGKKNFFIDLNWILLLGIFIETLENGEVRIERHLFVSQEYTELLFAHVVLIRKNI